LRGLQPRKKCAKALSFHIPLESPKGDKMKKKALSKREIKIRDALLAIAKVANKSNNGKKQKKTIVNKTNLDNIYAVQFTDLGVTIFEKEDKNG